MRSQANERRLGPHDLAAHDRQQHFISRQGLFGNLHEVLVQDDQVGELADFDRAGDGVQFQLLGSVQGDAAQHFSSRQGRVGIQPACILGAIAVRVQRIA
ncbi:hypothetical protein D3C85_1424270 [compost metagenome]